MIVTLMALIVIMVCCCFFRIDPSAPHSEELDAFRYVIGFFILKCFILPTIMPKQRDLKNCLLLGEPEKLNMLMVKMAWMKLRLKMGILGKNSEILT